MRNLLSLLKMAWTLLRVSGWSFVLVALGYAFSWVRCPWCGAWFSLRSVEQHGRRRDECKVCGRAI
jgi:hypothetical protein